MCLVAESFVVDWSLPSFAVESERLSRVELQLEDHPKVFVRTVRITPMNISHGVFGHVEME